MSDQEVVEKVMSQVELFYFDCNDESSGELMFGAFAAKHEHLFEDECDATSTENKLE